MKNRLLIAGGSGMIGSALKQEALRQGWEVTILSRHSGKDVIVWDLEQERIFLESPLAFEAIVNINGTSLGKGRWTEKRKKEIIDSRLKTCRLLEKYLRDGQLKTSTYIGIAGTGIYGDRGAELIDESSCYDPHTSWMSTLAKNWETAHSRMESLGIRTIIMRTAIVLDTKGGALKEILKTTPFGFLSYFGNGKQIWPWIHFHDVVRIMMVAIHDKSMHGIYLAAAPDSLSNKDLVKAISRHLKWKRIILPVPTPILYIMLGKMHSLLMDSCNAYPTRLLQHGLVFQFKTIDEAMEDLMKRR